MKTARAWGHVARIPTQFCGMMPSNLSVWRGVWHPIGEGQWRGNRGGRFIGWAYRVSGEGHVQFKRADPFSVAVYDIEGNLDHVERGSALADHLDALEATVREKTRRRDSAAGTRYFGEWLRSGGGWHSEKVKAGQKRAKREREARREQKLAEMLSASQDWAAAVERGSLPRHQKPPAQPAQPAQPTRHTPDADARPSGSYMALDIQIELGGVLDAIAEEFEGRPDLSEILDSAHRGLERGRILDFSPTVWGLGWESERDLDGLKPEKLLDFGDSDAK